MWHNVTMGSAKTIYKCTVLHIISQFLTTAIMKNNKAFFIYICHWKKKITASTSSLCAAINGSTIQFTHSERANWQLPTPQQRKAKPLATKIEHDKMVKTKLQWQKAGQLNRKKMGQKVRPKQKVVSSLQWEGDDCGMITILQMTAQAPSRHTNREAWLKGGYVLS